MVPGLLARRAAAAGGAAGAAPRTVGVGLGVGGALLLAELGASVLKPDLMHR